VEPTPDGINASKTILVVDDEPSLLEIASSLLIAEGYNVLTSANGVDAVQLAANYKQDIDLLLSDFQMPGISGVDLATQMTLQRPKLKVLLMSGFPGGMLILNEGWHFLPKPFIASQLRALVAGLVSPDRDSRFAG
jgi:DNA-binding NtrC family response regulator